jgi:hypothetical protein
VRWAGYDACIAHIRKMQTIFIGTLVRKRSVGRPACRWDDSVETDVKKLGYEDVAWIHLASG